MWGKFAKTKLHVYIPLCHWVQVPTAVKRELEVVFAPHLPPVSVDYYVTSAGIHGNQNMANCCPAT